MSLNDDVLACVIACQRCHGICLGMASRHCLEMGGAHVAAPHFRLMMACAEMCRASAALMLIGTEHHRQSCRLCGQICRDCAESCAKLDGMEECVTACRECAEHCERMAA